MAQFKAVVTNFVDVAPCLGIDFPGCGRSEFAPKVWSAYSPAALADLLRTVIQEHATPGQRFVLVGHSLGCSLSVLAALSPERGSSLQVLQPIGLVAICPVAEAPGGRTARVLRAFLWLPDPIFNIWRRWNKRGGTESSSVTNFVGAEAATELKELQVAFNAQSRTPVFRRMAWGVLSNGEQAAMPGLETWAKLRMPIFLIGGRGDTVTSVENIEKIAHALKVKADFVSSEDDRGQNPSSSILARPDFPKAASGPTIQTYEDITQPIGSRPSFATNFETKVLESSVQPRRLVKICVLPTPASHGLLYDPLLSRTLSGLIQSFLPTYVDKRLSASLQLQYLTDSHKWDVKNLAKWAAVPPVSAPILDIFYAMKSLREVDEHHNPTVFAREHGRDVKAVIDISNSTPVYDPQALESAGIEYHKFPTVSKIPPTKAETTDFNNLIDRLRPIASSERHDDQHNPRIELGKRMIAVHCHYGFNRTGFFIVAYLIERCGLRVRDAVELFKQARPPGIRHTYFTNELYVRYWREGGPDESTVSDGRG